MIHKIIWAVLITALSTNCAQPPQKSQQPTPKNIYENTANLLQYVDSKEDWHEFDEKIGELLPRAVPKDNNISSINDNSRTLQNKIDGLKQRPDASGYDSDEIQEILKRFEAPNSAKK
jgi:hypothetical protein